MSITVYVVDDEPIVLRPMKSLVNVFGYDCKVYQEGASLLEDMSVEPLKGLVLADLRMPTMSGLQLHAALKEAGVRIPFVLISGHADVNTLEIAMEQGVNGFLLKPFEPAELLAIIKEHIPMNDVH